MDQFNNLIEFRQALYEESVEKRVFGKNSIT